MRHFLTLILIATVTTLAAQGKETKETMESNHVVVVDFGDSAAGSWRAINDGVMGGLSQSGLSISGTGTGVFVGHVSLENNGGFASVRTSLGDVDLSEYDGLAVRVLGDGKHYRLRLRTDGRFDGIAYQAEFDTTVEAWQVIEIPFVSFLPTYRGRIPPDAPPLNTSRIHQIGLMIADKQEGPFRLEIQWVRAYRMATSINEDR